MPQLGPVTLPTMYRVRQTFQGTRLEDIPGGVGKALAAAQLPVKRGDTVAVGAGSRGIANIDVIADPDKNFVVIMKDGKIYKNLSRQSP